MRDAMRRRGPDGEGIWLAKDRRVGLAHRRLAIIDLSEAGSQPMLSADRQLCVTFNGEIYNYRELRRELEKKGVAFQSQSDTEVLLHLYAERGADLVHALRGMYAFAIWDERKKTLFLARDAFGIKPLYYANDGKTLTFASQVKALATTQANRSLDPAARVGFLLWGHVPEPFTIFRDIQALPAGSSLWLEAGAEPRIKRNFSVAEAYAEAQATPFLGDRREMRERLRAELLDTVRHHLVADVPVGVFLSAGRDSTTIAALAAEMQQDVHTVTLGFQEYRGTKNDETNAAAEVSRSIGSHHQTIWVTREDFERESDKFLSAMDQPTVDGMNTYFVAKAAADSGLKVALSGLGGDELFGGYSSFEEIPRLVSATSVVNFVPVLGRTFRYVTAPFLKAMTSPKYAGLLEYGGSYESAYLLRRSMFMPWELPELMDPDQAKEGWNRLKPLACLADTIRGIQSPYLKISALEIWWYMRNQLLRDADWSSMAHSLEVRVPLVDAFLLKALAPMLASSQRPTKLDMASAPAKRLPESVLKRRKTGFSVPTRQWLLARDPRQRARRLRGWALRLAAGWPTEFGRAAPPDRIVGPGSRSAEAVQGAEISTK